MEFYSRDSVTGKYVLVMWTDKNNIVRNAINDSIEESEVNEMNAVERMNRFIENYYKREKDKIEKEYEEKLEELTTTLDLYKTNALLNKLRDELLDVILKKFKKTLIPEYKDTLEKEEITMSGYITLMNKDGCAYILKYTEADKRKLNALAADKQKALEELINKCNNLKLLVDTCETMEDFNELLKAYDILNDNGTLI